MEPTASNSNTQTKGTAINPMLLVEILGVVVVGFVLYKLAHKFNLLGTSEATKQAQALGNDITLHDTVLNNISDPTGDFTKAIHAKFGANPTPAQMLSLLPNKANMPALMTQINDAHNWFSQNDAAKILGAFKQFRSQYEINFFATMYSLVQKTDMFEKLNKLLHDSDMATLRANNNSKPLI